MLPDNIPGRYHSIAEYHAMYLSGQLTPLAVVESLLPFIRRDISPKSHHSTAFIDSHVDVILEAARASTLRYKEGKSLGILDGVPTAIKDESNLAGYRTTSGRKKNDAIFPVEDKSAWSMEKWQEAGGIVLGKLNMHWGTPRNPHNDQVRLLGASPKVLLLLKHYLRVLKASLVAVSSGLEENGANLFNSTIQVAHLEVQLTSYRLVLFP
jgi:hypothetical protein